jgi:hypothetical protein
MIKSLELLPCRAPDVEARRREHQVTVIQLIKYKYSWFGAYAYRGDVL